MEQRKTKFLAIAFISLLSACSPTKADEKPKIKHYSNYIDRASSVTFDYKNPNYGIFKYNGNEARVDGPKTYDFISQFDNISFCNLYTHNKVDEFLVENNAKDYIMIDVSYHWVTETSGDRAIQHFMS